MKWNLEKLLEQIKFLESKINNLEDNQLVYNYLKLEELIDFYNFIKPLTKNPFDSLNLDQTMYVQNRINCLNDDIYADYLLNKKFYVDYSKKVSSLVNEPFLEEVFSRRLSKSEALNLIKEFLKNFDINLLDYFKYMCEEQQINFCKIRQCCSYAGFISLYSKEPYIICNQEIFDIYGCFILVHEFGHAINRIVSKGCSTKKLLLISNSIYEEVVPIALEKIFLNYLTSNNLFKKEAILLKKDEVSEFKERCKMLHLLSSLSIVKRDTSLNISFSKKELKKLSSTFGIDYHIDFNSFNLKELLRYFYGFALGFEYAFEYQEDQKITRTNLLEFIKNIPLIDNSNVNGIIVNSKILKKGFNV